MVTFPIIFIFLGLLFDRVLKTNKSLKNANELIKEEQKKSAINSKFASLGLLSAGIGHEINNPLSIILMNTTIIQKRLKALKIDDEKINKKIKSQIESVNRISKIVQGLRTMARTDTDSVEIFSIHKYTLSTIGLIDEIYAKEGILIITNFNAKQDLIRANNGKFQQIVLNLISNSKDAILEAGAEGIINLNTYNKDSKIIFEVKDNGPGIPKEIQNKIFDTFFTTKEVGKGTGMGLAISLKLIEEMSADIKLKSDIGQGTTFELVFDYVEGKETHNDFSSLGHDPIQYEKQKRSATINKESKTILIVEDEHDINEMLTEYLKEANFNAIQAYDGKKGIEAFQNNHIDLIITDLQMPNMTGKEMVTILREEMNADCPIVITTGGSTDEADPSFKVLQKLTQEIIRKPFSQDKIIKTVTQLIHSTVSEEE